MIALWYVGGTAAGAAIGWLAAQLQAHGFAPVLLLPLVAGVTLGFCLRKLAGRLGITKGHALCGAILFGIVAVSAEHTWLYQDFRRQWQAERDANPQVAMFRSAEPLSAAEYFRREASPTRVALWSLDAALIVAGTLIVVVLNRKEFVVADDAN